MKVGIYQFGGLVIEEYGDGLIAKENGKYIAPNNIHHVRPSRNPAFEREMESAFLANEQDDICTLSEYIHLQDED